MRKRAQRKSKPEVKKPIPKHIDTKPKYEEKTKFKLNKNWWVAVSLIGIFLLVLFFNSYFNITSNVAYNDSGEGLSRYLLSGPDPYYNMRLVDKTLETGRYPYYGDLDPLLKYPFGRTGLRAPLFNMMAIGFSRTLTPFMPEVDAVGLSMQFIPALFGALLVFPVYFIGKTVAGKMEGLIAALFVALIPIHLGSGHGSAFSLFDHDSFNLFLFVMTFLFLIKAIKEKDSKKTFLYAVLGGVPLAALSMTWVQAQFLYAVVAVYAIIQMFVDIFTNRINKNTFISTVVLLFTGYLLSLPVIASQYGGFSPDISLYLCLAVGAFGIFYLFFGERKIPWTISIPSIFIIIAIGLVFLFYIDEISSVIPAFSSLNRLSEVVFGSGIYGEEVSLTIAEANTYDISRTIMSFGPALYWMGWIGFLLISYLFLKNSERREYLFLIVLFIVDIWLTSIAGRFINDMVPLIAIFTGISLWYMLTKIDFSQMIKNIKNIGFNLHGLRKAIKISHIFGILFIAFILVFPQTYMAFDASVPGTKKQEIMGDLDTAGFGLNLYTERYWVTPLLWLSTQDANEEPENRPAVISWWDYGFYETAIGKHPTVADNFQDGIPPASNFHTSTTEKEAVSIWATLLISGAKHFNNKEIPQDIISTINKYYGNNSEKLIEILRDAKNGDSYNKLISPEYGNENLRISRENALYQDSVEILSNISDEDLTSFYHEIQELTGRSVRYYMVEGYDINIMNVFTFLSDTGTYGYSTSEDDYFITKYTHPSLGLINESVLEGISDEQKQALAQQGYLDYRIERKDKWFETMVYKCYVGAVPKESFEQNPNDGYELLNAGYSPTAGLKHFVVKYLNSTLYYARGGANLCTGLPGVVISKYYEGAKINGTVTFKGEPVSEAYVYMIQEEVPIFDQNLGIHHDNMKINEDGSYNLVAPAGEVAIQITRYPELGVRGIILDQIKLNSTGNLAPITEEEATRKEGVNYHRIVNISVDPGTISGYLYNDLDDDGAYNSSVDTVLEDVKVNMLEITDIDSQGMPLSYGNIEEKTTDENGYYNSSDLMPGIYIVTAEKDGYQIHQEYVTVFSDEETKYDIAKQKTSSLSGKVYYDSNDDGDYNSGEEISDAQVKLIYGGSTTFDTATSGSDGSYSFNNIPTSNNELTYTLNVTKISDVTGKLAYSKQENIKINANETKKYNISLNLVKVSVTGYVRKPDSTPVENITVKFDVDNSVSDNTAEKSSVVSDNETLGYYNVLLNPGSYNITVENTYIDINGEQIEHYYTGKINVSIGEGVKTRDITLIQT